MLLNYFTLAVLNIFLFVLATATPQRCNEITNYGKSSVENYNITFELLFDVTITNDYSNLITIKNITTSFLNIDQNVFEDENPGILNVCLETYPGATYHYCYNFTGPISTVLGNETFDFYILWFYKNNEHRFDLFFGFVDAGNLIFYNGSMFTAKDECMLYNKWDRVNLNGNTRGETLTSHTSCCTSMMPVLQAPTSVPKCTNFHATSSFINITNDKTLASMSADFVLSNYDIKAKGVTDSYSYLVYGVNSFSCQIQNINNYQYCEFSFNDRENEIKIELGPYGIPEWYPYSFVGRIILRDNQTLIEEGIAFTPGNNCLNSTVVFGDDVNIVNQFCCTQFEGSFPTSTLPPTQQPFSTTFQQCNKINASSSYSDTLMNVTITADLEISSYEDDKNNIEIKNLMASTPLNFPNPNTPVCYALDGEHGDGTCVSNNTMISVNDQIVNIYSPWQVNQSGFYPNQVPFYFGIINEGSYISYDGQMYTETKKCSSWQGNANVNKACCTSFIPFQSPLFNFTRCTNFNLLSTIYYNQTNQIYTSVTAKLTLTETDIMASAAGSGGYSDDYIYTPLYSINGNEFKNSVNNTQFGGFHLSSSESVILIHLGSPTPPWYSPQPGVLVGRIMLLNDQTYMDMKGVMPFYGNKCEKTTRYYRDDRFYVVSELCCADIPEATTTSTFAATTTTKVDPATTSSTVTSSAPSASSSSSIPLTSSSTSTSPLTNSSSTSQSYSTTFPSTSTNSRSIPLFLNFHLLILAIFLYCLQFCNCYIFYY